MFRRTPSHLRPCSRINLLVGNAFEQHANTQADGSRKARGIVTNGLVLFAIATTILNSGCSPEHFVDTNENEGEPGSIELNEHLVAEPEPVQITQTLDATNALPVPSGKMAMNKMPMAMPNPADIVFKDEIVSNITVPVGLDGLVFLDTSGKRVALKQYLGKKNVVLVFTEGFAGGMLCPFCKTQTSRLVANYDRFAELDTEILVVYPGTRDHLDEFVEAAKTSEKSEVDRIPFPLVLDEELSAVGYFNIASNLAHPSTFIIDKYGDVRLAYVGADMSADRPSIRAMLGVIRNSDEN